MNKDEKLPNPKTHHKKKPSRFYFGGTAEKGYLVENLSLLLASGMTVSESLDAVKMEIRSPQLRAAIDFIQEDIVSGSPLWKAINNVHLFPEHMIALIRVGEESGKLSQNLQVISIEQQKERDFASKISSAMLYPVFVFSLTLIVGIGISWFLLPRLANVFASLKIELPLMTSLLIQFGSFLGKYGYFVVPLGLTLAALLIFFCFFYTRTKFIGQALLFSFPPARKLIQEVQIARLGYVLGTLLSAGIPIVDALRSLAAATDFYSYKRLYLQIGEAIEEGNSLEKSFLLSKKSRMLIPLPIQQLIFSGGKSGSLAKTLLNIGTIFEERTNVTTKNLSVILEPVLLVIVWLGVVGVSFAVILPLYSLIGGLNTDPAPPPPVSSVSQPVETPTPTPIVQSIRILETTTGTLNVRQEPSTTSAILTTVNNGDILPFISQQDGWYQITLPDQTSGWVSSEFVEEVQ